MPETSAAGGKVIIGIHGLANKPDKDTLAKWWRQSLEEGLQNIGVRQPEFEFDLVYWADRLYAVPLHQRPLFKFDPLYNSQPYIAAKPDALQPHKTTWRDRIRAGINEAIAGGIETLRKVLDSQTITNFVLKKLARDLHIYYEGKPEIDNGHEAAGKARQVLTKILKDKLKAQHAQGRQILFIAHSMGTIIAYDALRDLGREEGNEVDVSHFVTIGSPLGLPLVKGRIVNERASGTKTTRNCEPPASCPRIGRISQIARTRSRSICS